MRPAFLSALVLLALSVVARATPLTLSLTHEGYLLGANDQPLDTGSQSFTFTVFDQPSATAGENPVWIATCAVPVRQGYYAVRLGSLLGGCGPQLDVSHLPTGEARWLDVTVGTVALQPRLLLTAAPTAATASVAANAEALGGVAAALYALKTDLPTAGGGLALAGGVLSIATDATSLAKVSGNALSYDGTLLQGSAPLSIAGSVSVTGAGNAFTGDASGLRNLGAALVGTSGNTLTQALASVSGTNADANRILGVSVDNAALADGRVLKYDAASGKLVYSTVASGTGVPPTVPSSVNWSGGTATGNAKCAALKGVCTGARDGSNNAISCSVGVATGSATCAVDPSINDGVSWTGGTQTGNSSCAAVVASCVQSYDGNGVAIACNAGVSTGVASCLRNTSTQGFDAYANWNDTSKSGLVACALLGKACAQAYDGNGGDLSCSANTNPGRARCRAPVGTDPWDRYAQWVNVVSSGTIECAKLDANCVDEFMVGAAVGTVACSANQGGSGYTTIARCRSRTASDTWDKAVFWQNVVSSGYIECGKVDANCVDEAFAGAAGGTVACTANQGGANYSTVARCKSRTASDTWDKAVFWQNVVSNGYIECGKVDANCVDEAYAGAAGGTVSCTANQGGPGYTTLARCKSRTSTDPWDKLALWQNAVSTGYIECAKLDANCIDESYAGSAGGTVGCNVNQGGNGYLTAAHCKSRTATDPWDRIAMWQASVSSGSVECTKLNAVCLDVGFAGTAGGNVGCPVNQGGGGYTSVARCRATTAADGWDTFAQWTNPALYGNVECAKIGAECVGVDYAGTAGGTVTCNTIAGGAGYVVAARCKRATVATNGWATPVTWSNLTSTGNAQCLAAGGGCVSVLGFDGTSHACTDSFGSGSGGVAKCHVP